MPRCKIILSVRCFELQSTISETFHTITADRGDHGLEHIVIPETNGTCGGAGFHPSAAPCKSMQPPRPGLCCEQSFADICLLLERPGARHPSNIVLRLKSAPIPGGGAYVNGHFEQRNSSANFEGREGDDSWRRFA